MTQGEANFIAINKTRHLVIFVQIKMYEIFCQCLKNDLYSSKILFKNQSKKLKKQTLVAIWSCETYKLILITSVPCNLGQ